MKVIRMECPYCGGSLEVKPDQKIVTCSYCGKQILLESTAKEKEAEHRKAVRKEKARKKRILKAARIILILFAIFGMIMAVSTERLIAALIAIFQIILLIASFIPSILKKSKKIHPESVLPVISVFLSIPFFITAINPYFEPVKDLKWPSTSLSEHIPRPQSDKGTVILSSEQELIVYVNKVSSSEYQEYVSACRKKGFTTYAESDSYNYEAADQDGYVLSMNYSSANKEMDITLDAPKPWKSITWPVSKLASVLPQPDSHTGSVETDSDVYLEMYVKDTDSGQFGHYVDEVVKAGFDQKYSRYDRRFYGQNRKGYSVYITLQAGNIMHIALYAPD